MADAWRAATGFCLLLVAAARLAGAVDTFGPLVKATVGEVWPKPQSQAKYSGYMVVRPSNFTFKVPRRQRWCQRSDLSASHLFYQFSTHRKVGKLDVRCPVYHDVAGQVSQGTCGLLEAAVERYAGYISRHVAHYSARRPAAQPSWTADPLYVGELDHLDIQLSGSCEDLPHLYMVESYELQVNSPGHEKSAVVSSQTIWGILRGLETFSQLLHIDQSRTALIVNSTAVTDRPRFSHRGLHLDTARHYQPLRIIRTMLDGMEMNKMNVFHWHIVDSQSFPYQSKVFPNLSAKGAYDPETLIYTHDDIMNITEYARVRGIRVVPEFDTPGHTLSWGPGQANLLTPCYFIDKPDGTFGPINPTLDSSYTFIRELFREVSELFPDKYIHLGGDEVDFDCWERNPNISAFMSANGIVSYRKLEQYYMQKVVNITTDLNASSVVWQEVFDNGVDIPEGTVVHIWTGSQETELYKVTAAGHPTLLSACWYLDALQSGGDWKKYYDCEPTSFPGSEEQKKLVIGGEACMWAEVVDESNVVSRVWPRASAAAEKLWSPADADTEDGAAQRLEEHYCRMRRRGVQAQPPNGPGFCR